jgi:hypothetical protein
VTWVKKAKRIKEEAALVEKQNSEAQIILTAVTEKEANIKIQHGFDEPHETFDVSKFFAFLDGLPSSDAYLEKRDAELQKARHSLP